MFPYQITRFVHYTCTRIVFEVREFKKKLMKYEETKYTTIHSYLYDIICKLFYITYEQFLYKIYKWVK